MRAFVTILTFFSCVREFDFFKLIESVQCPEYYVRKKLNEDFDHFILFPIVSA